MMSAVLVEVGRRLSLAADGYADVARLGDDEFIVVVEDETLAELIGLGDRIVAAFVMPVAVAGRIVSLSASVGIAYAADASTTRAELMGGAAIAARRARVVGGSRVEVFNDDLRGALARSAELERLLAAGLAAGEVTFELQPVWDLSEHRVSGFEALARWTLADGSKVSPAEFIAAAELSDLVIDLDNFVMNNAARTVATWNSTHGTSFSLAVNISGRHLLSRRIVDDVREVLRQTEIKPAHLVIEITETVLLGDLDVATTHLRELRQLGVRIAIDDFGSGYTSLVHLRTLPADVLKIDRAFIAELDTAEGQSLMKLMIEAAHTLELGVVAEGVETASQLQQLELLRCDEVQGFHLGRPMSVTDAETLFVAAQGGLG
jgi:EAL domain-containing protein (putative c-di-GMP-specific phosphodiesterase class I)